jgi:L-rhamnose mutarotase
MKRVCFLLQLKKDRVAEYLRAHRVWPEMKAAIQKAGIRNYSMFCRKDGLLINYFEAKDPHKSLEELGKTDVNRRWQERMAPFFESGSGDTRKSRLEWVKQIFYLG